MAMKNNNEKQPPPEEKPEDRDRPEAAPSFEINQDYKDNYLRSNYESDDDFEIKNLEEDLHKIVIDKIKVMPEFASLRSLEIKDLSPGLEVKILNQKKGIIALEKSKLIIRTSDNKVYEVISDGPQKSDLPEKTREIVDAIIRHGHGDYFYVKEIKGYSNSLYGHIDNLIKKKLIARTDEKDKYRGAKFKILLQKNDAENKIRISNIDHAVDPIMKLKKLQLRELYRTCEQELIAKLGKSPDLISFLYIFGEYFKVHHGYLFNCLPMRLQGEIINEFNVRGIMPSTKGKNGESFKAGAKFQWNPDPDDEEIN